MPLPKVKQSQIGTYLKNFDKVWAHYSLAPAHYRLSKALPADPVLATQIERVIAAFRLTGWHPEQSPLRPFVVAWRLPDDGVIDIDAALAALAPLEEKVSLGWSAGGYSYEDSRNLRAAQIGLVVAERLLSGVAPMAPYSSFDGGWVGAALPPIGNPYKVQEHLQGLAYLAEHGMLDAAGFVSARFRFPLHPVPIGV